MWFYEWLDTKYLDYWPFGILTEKAILISLKKKNPSEMRIFLFTQSIVGYSGRVNWCLGSFNTTIDSTEQKRGLSQMKTLGLVL